MMKSKKNTINCLLLAVFMSLFILSSCKGKTALPVTELPIGLVFKGDSGPKTGLLGLDITYLGSASVGQVYSGARDENASLVIIRWNNQDYFYSLKGLDINNLDKVVCNVDCDIRVGLVEGVDLLAEIVSINPTKPLAEPKVIWDKSTLKPASSGKCDLLPFTKGDKAVILVPLKMRSSPEIPENFNSNTTSYMAEDEEVEVLNNTQDAWVNIKKNNGEAGWSKQCSTLTGRFMNPKK